MQDPEARENYPPVMVIASNFLTLSIYGIGAFLVCQFGLIWLCLYLLFIAILEFRLLGSTAWTAGITPRSCAFGKGRIANLVFPRGKPERSSGKS